MTGDIEAPRGVAERVFESLVRAHRSTLTRPTMSHTPGRTVDEEDGRSRQAMENYIRRGGPLFGFGRRGSRLQR